MLCCWPTSTHVTTLLSSSLSKRAVNRTSSRTTPGNAADPAPPPGTSAPPAAHFRPPRLHPRMAPQTRRKAAACLPDVAPAIPPPVHKRSRKPVVVPSPSPAPTPEAPIDRLSPLSSELLSLILAHLSSPAAPDLGSLFQFSLVSKSLLPHVRLHMYRELKIDTRTNAHAMHRTLHGNEVNRSVKSITADVGTMAKTSSQWLGTLSPSPLPDTR